MWVLGTFAALMGTANAETLCVYDPSGANGEVYLVAKDFRTEAASWGVNLKMKPYTDEQTASQDFKAGKCDGVLITGTRARLFHRFSGTLEAMGALPTYKQLKKAIKTISQPKAAKLMKGKRYECAGVAPAGAVLLYVNDKKINTVEAIAGKRLATLDYDQAAKYMVRHVGASLVPADVGTFAGLFNNRNADIAYAPATAYHALELYKGVGSKGGVIDYPLAQMTFQFLVHAGHFTPEFTQQSRGWFYKTFDRFAKLSRQAESRIKKKHWITISGDDKKRYAKMFQETRIKLRDEKIYNRTMLKILRKIRCKADATRAECATKVE
jgi:hypothetical protein